MTHPVGGGEAASGMPAALPAPEVIDPLALRLQEFATAAGRILNSEEVQLAGWFYQAGGRDMVGSIARASVAAADAQAEGAPATVTGAQAEAPVEAEDIESTREIPVRTEAAAPAVEAPTAEEAPAAEQSAQPESFLSIVRRHPSILRVDLEKTVKGGFLGRTTTDVETKRFANAPGVAVLDAGHNIGASDRLLDHQARPGSKNSHEVVIFTGASDRYAEQMPEDTRGGEAVVMDYRATSENSTVAITMRRVLPAATAAQIDGELARGDMRITRMMVEDAINTELADPIFADPDSLVGDVRDHYDALIEASGALQAFAATYAKQKSPAVLRLSNVAGIAGGNESRDVTDGGVSYSRVETPITKKGNEFQLQQLDA